MSLISPSRNRLAPSPTGALHLGNARSFLIAWLSARSKGGKVVLRIEDLDHPKIKPGTAEQAIEDLRWLGLDWDEGPDKNGDFGPYIQTQRIDLYKKALEVLKSKDLVYPCVCSRKDVEEGQSAPHSTNDGLYYDGKCRDKFSSFKQSQDYAGPDRIPAWRFKTPQKTVRFTDGFHGPQEQDVSSAIGDFVIARHELGAGYMLGVVVDDSAMKITEVLRGDDLLSATFRQILLYEALDLKPPQFVHVPLVVAEDGRRLAKRHGDTRISALREQGISPEKIIGLLAWWSGWAERGGEISCQDLIPRFDLQKIPKQQVILTQKIKMEFNIQD